VSYFDLAKIVLFLVSDAQGGEAMGKSGCRVLFACLAAALVFGAVLLSSKIFGEPPAQSKEIVLKFDPDAFKTVKNNGRDFILLDLPQCHYPADPVGAPQLPAYFARVLVPRGAKFEKVTITDSKAEKLPGNFEPNFVRPPCHPGQQPPTSEPDQKIYGGDSPYPTETVEFLREGIMRGHRIFFLRVNPIQYLPKSKEFLFHSQVTVLIEYSIDQTRALTIKPCRKGEPFWQVVADSVDNPSDMETISEQEAGEGSALRGDLEPLQGGTETVTYLIITSSAFQGEDGFKPLADWKKKKGVPAKIVTTESINTDYTGVDLQEKIKRCIIDYVNNHGTIYVLLGGDIDTIPDRDCYGYVASAPPTSDRYIPCDLYYSGLDDINWNDDGDNKCGEIPSGGDSVDMEPDVFVGRYSCRTTAQVQAVVNKVLEYEKTAPAAGFSKELILSGVMLWGWFNPLTGGYQDGGTCPSGWVSDAEYWSGKMYNDCIAPYWSPNRTNFFDTTPGLTLTGAALQAELDTGFGIVNMKTHGNVTVWGTETDTYSTNNALSQINDNKFSIIYTIACYVNAFDDAYVCLGEAFTRNGSYDGFPTCGGGAVAFIACSRYGWGSPGQPTGLFSDEYNREFYKKLLSSGLYHLGEAFAMHKYTFVPQCNSYNPYRWLQFGINLIGDPELPVWTDNPQTMSVIYPVSIGTGSQTLSITAEPYSHVCLRKVVDSTDEVYVYGDADVSGNYSAVINPATTGTLKLTVTKHNFYPFEADISVAATRTVTVSSACGTPNPPAGAHQYANGSSVTVSCGPTPFAGPAGTQYVCTGWTGSGDIPPTGTEASYTIAAIAQDSAITWAWKTQYQLTTAVNLSVGGSVTPNGTIWQDANSLVYLSASLNAGYIFTGWSGNLTGSENPVTVTMNAPKSITANFTPACTLTIRSQYGTADPPVGTHTYPINTVVTASVGTPVYGSSGIRYLCTGWRARGSPDTLLAEGTGNSVTFTITMNTTLTWRWKTQYQLITTVSPEGGGTIDVSPTSSDGWYDAKSTVTLTAIENEGYDFSYWTGGLRGIANPQNLLLRGPRTVTANFIPK
jgi:uncharacterized repeat protein (TIGR02543 family)